MLGKNEKFGVVIAVSKAYDSATSFVYAREVDGNEFGGSGKPFQLSRRSNDFSKHEWDNDILTDEKIGLGTAIGCHCHHTTKSAGIDFDETNLKCAEVHGIELDFGYGGRGHVRHAGSQR